MNTRRHDIYLDYNAMAPVAPECAGAVIECLEADLGNPSSKHFRGERAKAILIEARAQVAQLLGAQPPEIVFTSGGTESIHTAIFGALALCPEKRHIVTSEVEHPASLLLLKHLETLGVRVTYLPVTQDGRLDPARVRAAIAEDTALVSLMWANNETGVVFPVMQIAEACRNAGVLFHCDAVQAVGKTSVDVRNVAVDFLSLSGHKLHAPAGVGALYVRKGIKLPPLLFGHQERARRGGTENIAHIAALGIASLLAFDGLQTDVPRVSRLRDLLETEIKRNIATARVNGELAVRVGNTSSIRFGDVPAEIIVEKLDRAGICVAQGAACSAGGTEPSHVLLAMGLSPDEALATVRFSLGRYTQDREIIATVRELVQIYAALSEHAA